MTYRKLYRKHRVFVYGTLKQGFPNHFFLAGQKSLGPAVTAEPYALYEDVYPLVCKQERVSPIRGEVYEMSDAILKRIDILEDHPVYYQREKVDVDLDSGERVSAWLYFFPEPRGRLYPGGDWQPTPPEPDGEQEILT